MALLAPGLIGAACAGSAIAPMASKVAAVTILSFSLSRRRDRKTNVSQNDVVPRAPHCGSHMRDHGAGRNPDSAGTCGRRAAGVTWGSAVAATLWVGGSLLLSWYVTNFGTYNATYGSLGAV